MGRNTHPSERKSVKSGSAGIGKSNSAASRQSSSKKSTSKTTNTTTNKTTSTSSKNTSSTLSGGVSLSEKDPNSKNYRPDRWNSDGSMTDAYRDALAKDENDRIMSQGGWGKGYYDRDTGKITNSSGSGSSSSGGSWSTSTAGSSYFDDDPYQDYLNALEEQRKAEAEALRKQVEAAVGNLEGYKGTLKDQFVDSASDAYVQNMLAKKRLPEQLAAQGIQGGLAESSNVAMDTAYGNAYNNLQNTYNQGLSGIDRDILNTRANGDITIAQNAGQYSQQMAQAALQQAQQQAQWEQQYQMMLQQAQMEKEAAAQQQKYNLEYLAAQQGYKTANAGTSGRSAKTSYKDNPSYIQLYTELMTGAADWNDVTANANMIVDAVGVEGYEDLLDRAIANANLGITRIPTKGIKQPRIRTNQGMATDWTMR